MAKGMKNPFGLFGKLNISRPSPRIAALGVAAVFVLISLAYYEWAPTNTGDTPEIKIAVDALKIDNSSDFSSNLEQKFGTSTSFDLKKPEINNAVDEQLSTIDAFSKQFITEYMQVSQPGQSLDQTTKDALVNYLAQNQGTTGASFKDFSEKDIVIAPSSNATTIRAYANKLGKIVWQNRVDKLGDPLAILNAVITQGDAQSVKLFDPIMRNYATVVASALKMQVPLSVASYHLDFVNAVNGIVVALNSFKNAVNDPLQAAADMTLYSDRKSSLSMAIAELKQFFNDNKIVFARSEYGYLFRPAI